jgi:flagellar biogenesis protein FliO
MMMRVAWSEEMRVSQRLRQNELNNVGAAAVTAMPGLADWVLNLLRGWRGRRETQREQLRLLETLSLGGKRQLMLVMCAGERFLVGGGPESVETIVRLKSEIWPDMSAESLDEPCR